MKNNFSVPRLVIFFIGMVIVVALPLLLLPMTERGREFAPMFSAVLVLIYIGYAFPWVFQYSRENAGGTIVSGVVYYRGMGVCSLIAIAAVLLQFFGLIMPNITIAILLVDFFAVLVWIYLAFFTAKHIEGVKEEEERKKAPVADLRREAASVALKIRTSFPEERELIKKAEKLSDDLRYLSPTDDPNAAGLEDDMSAKLMDLEREVSLGIGSPDKAARQLDEVSMLYQQRKSIF